MNPKRSSDLRNGIDLPRMPSRDWKIDFEKGRIREKITGLEAIKQAVLLRLGTEKGKYAIYSEGYGRSFSQADFGSPLRFVLVKNEIGQTLEEDDRILQVGNFEFIEKDKAGGEMALSFAVETQFGIEKEMMTL